MSATEEFVQLFSDVTGPRNYAIYEVLDVLYRFAFSGNEKLMLDYLDLLVQRMSRSEIRDMQFENKGLKMESRDGFKMSDQRERVVRHNMESFIRGFRNHMAASMKALPPVAKTASSETPTPVEK